MNTHILFSHKFGGAEFLPPAAPQLGSQALNAFVSISSMAADGLADSTSMKRLEKLVKRN